MSKIKIAELFYSIQGEGKYMGVPSVFLRTFGCNFRCAGFGMPNGDLSQEVESIANRIIGFKEYRDLPLVSTGCDSYASWDVRFKHLSPMFTTDQIAQNIANLLPFKEWKDEHLVITGGEPLLGWQRAYPDLLENEHLTNLKELTFETNGSQALTEEFKEYLKQWTSRTCPNGYVRKYDDLTFSVSAKLSCSGENRADAIRPDLVCEYEKLGYTYLKFVVASEDDAKEAIETTKLYRDAGFLGPVYLMPVGGVEKVYQLNHRKVAELAMKNGLRYSDRLQVPLFRNAWGT